jgi:hypothetical protein
LAELIVTGHIKPQSRHVFGYLALAPMWTDFTSMTGDEPGPVVMPSKLAEGGPDLLGRVQRPDPQEVLFQCPDEMLSDAIAFGFTDKRGRRFDSWAFDFGLKILRHVIGPVIVSAVMGR